MANSKVASVNSDAKLLGKGVITTTLNFQLDPAVGFYSILEVNKPPTLTADKLHIISYSKTVLFDSGFLSFNEYLTDAEYGDGAYLQTNIGVVNLSSTYRITENKVTFYYYHDDSLATPTSPYVDAKTYYYIYYI